MQLVSLQKFSFEIKEIKILRHEIQAHKEGFDDITLLRRTKVLCYSPPFEAIIGEIINHKNDADRVRVRSN